MTAPLAERIRPKTLADFKGQSHILGVGSSLRKSIESNVIPSMIFWGPPGSGKTTLAYLISQFVNRKFHTLSAISSGVKEVRDVIQKVEHAGIFQERGSILFIDEIHRFSKSQQDSLLGAVEKGIITLIGATTENPSFEVNNALLSRCQVFTLKPHSLEDLRDILIHAIANDEILNKKNIHLQEISYLIRLSGGDARKLLNIFELIIGTFKEGEKIVITDKYVENNAQSTLANYDKNGEQHYDIVSAFIKSIRGSDVNASIYWLARMITGGEDLTFIARRLLIIASEDIGIANPNALLMASACFNAVAQIGYPESRIILSQCAIYLASSPKGNASYIAIDEAIKEVQKTGDLSVPLHLRNAPTKLMEELGYGENYKYSHDYAGNFIDQEFLPKELVGKNFFIPGSSKKEKEVFEMMQKLWDNKYDLK